MTHSVQREATVSGSRYVAARYGGVLTLRGVGRPSGFRKSQRGLPATLTITCLIGTAPAGAEEGITLNVDHLINFGESTGGNTLFILENNTGRKP